MIWAWRNSSVTSTTATSEVSLTSEMSVLLSEGTAIRAAWGSTTRRSVVTRPMPTVAAASHCPRGTARIEPRTDSEA